MMNYDYRSQNITIHGGPSIESFIENYDHYFRIIMEIITGLFIPKINQSKTFFFHVFD